MPVSSGSEDGATFHHHLARPKASRVLHASATNIWGVAPTWCSDRSPKPAGRAQQLALPSSCLPKRTSSPLRPAASQTPNRIWRSALVPARKGAHATTNRSPEKRHRVPCASTRRRGLPCLPRLLLGREVAQRRAAEALRVGGPGAGIPRLPLTCPASDHRRRPPRRPAFRDTGSRKAMMLWLGQTSGHRIEAVLTHQESKVFRRACLGLLPMAGE